MKKLKIKFYVINERSNKNDREIIEKYLLGEKVIRRRERYETGIYIKYIKNIVDYDTENYGSEHNIEYIANQDKKTKNQIISSIETMQETKN